MFDLNKCKFFLTKLFNNFFLNNNFQIKESIKAVEIRSKIGFQIHALSPFSDWLSFASRLGRHLDNISLKTVLRNRLFCLCSELSLIEVELYIYLTFYVADFLFYSSNPRLLRLSENYSCAKLSKNRNWKFQCAFSDGTDTATDISPDAGLCGRTSFTRRQ